MVSELVAIVGQQCFWEMHPKLILMSWHAESLCLMILQMMERQLLYAQQITRDILGKEVFLNKWPRDNGNVFSSGLIIINLVCYQETKA